MIVGLHQELERDFERLRDFEAVEGERVVGTNPRHQGHDAEAAEGEVEIEIADRLDQAS